MFYLWFFAAPIAGCVHGEWKLEYHVVWHTPTGQHGKWYEKYSLHLIFTFYLNRDTSVLELFPVVVFKRKHPVLTHLPTMNRTRLGLWQKDPKWCWYWYISLQTRTRIMTINQHNSFLHAFSVPDWSEMCGVVDALTGLLLSATRYIFTASEIAKMWCQEVDIYIHIDIIYNHPHDNHMDFLYRYATLKIM